jgi:hypothetical protein
MSSPQYSPTSNQWPPAPTPQAATLLAFPVIQNNANPTGTSSVTAVMMGLNLQIFTQLSRTVLILVQGQISTNTTGDGAEVSIRTGTYPAPTNGAAGAGTDASGVIDFTGLTGLLSVPFALVGLVQNAPLNSFYWVDLALKALTGGTATVAHVSTTIMEIPVPSTP